MWFDKALHAAVALQADRTNADDNAALTLLTDLRDIFGSESFLTSTTLLDSLIALDTSPWSEWRGGKALTGRGLAKLLEPFGIHPDRTRDARGYSSRAFDDAWERFLPSHPADAVTSVTSVTDGQSEHETMFGEDLA